MRHCPYCGHPNPDDINICTLCKRSLRRHKNRWIRWSIVIVLSVFLIATVFLMEYLSKKPEILMPKSKAKLELISSIGYRTRASFMIVQGRVRNVSGTKLNDIFVVVSWYNKNQKLLGRNKEPLLHSALHNYQVTKFEVKVPYKKGMESYDISFETEDGAVLYSADTRDRNDKLPAPVGIE